jgi:short-subunit dehydrogenase
MLTSQRRPGAIIVGASSGIGAALASELTRRGYQVALVARRAPALEAIAARLNTSASGVARTYPHDVRDYDAAPALFARICADLEGAPLTLLVYASGAMAEADPAGWPFEAEREMIETNLIGAMRWLALGAAVFARQGHGSLVGVSSVAGDRGRKGNGAYMASKAGLSVYLESLRYRLASRGVRVVTIKPGLVATPMIAGKQPPRPLVISAEQAARRIAEVSARGPEVVYVPARWGLIMTIVRTLPSFVMKRLTF